MNIDNFTDRAKAIIVDAQNKAILNDNQRLDDWHLLAALLEDQQGIIKKILGACGLDADALLTTATQQIDRRNNA